MGWNPRPPPGTKVENVNENPPERNIWITDKSVCLYTPVFQTFPNGWFWSTQTTLFNLVVYGGTLLSKLGVLVIAWRKCRYP